MIDNLVERAVRVAILPAWGSINIIWTHYRVAAITTCELIGALRDPLGKNL